MYNLLVVEVLIELLLSNDLLLKYEFEEGIEDLLIQLF